MTLLLSQKIKKFSFIFLLFLGLLCPFYLAQAGIAAAIAGYLPLMIIMLVLRISQYFLGFCSAALNWVTSEGFIGYSYTNPATNPIIDIGWVLVRDLVNMFFVVALVIIGLATALRIKEYQAQKALPRLILVALLINFSPIICGVIVDASNIFMEFFLSKLSGMQNLNNTFTEWTNNTATAIGGLQDPLEILDQIFQGLAMIIFNALAGSAFFLFTLIFAVRHLAIWMLVILSPIAFFSLIFPKVPVSGLGGVWDKWLNAFLQWCIVGVTAAFFLYLGDHIIRLASATTGATEEIIRISPPEGMSAWATFMQVLTPYIVGVAFTWIGLTTALATSAPGAEGAIKLGKWAGRTAREPARRMGRRAGIAVGKPIAEGLKGWGERLEKRAEELPPEAGRKKVLLRTLGKAIEIPTRPIGKAIGVGVSRLAAGRREEINKRIEDLEKYTPEELADRSFAVIPQEEKIAIATLLARKEGSKGLTKLKGKEKEAAILASTISPEYMKEIVGADPGLTNIEEVANAFVDITKPGKDREEVKKIIQETALSEVDAIKRLAHKKVVKASKRKDIVNWSPEILESGKFLEDVVLTKNINFIAEVREHHGQPALDKLTRKMEELGAEKIAPENMALLRTAIFTPLGRSILPALEGAKTLKQIEQLLKKILKKEPPPPPPPVSPRVERLRRGEEEKRKEMRERIERIKKRGEK